MAVNHVSLDVQKGEVLGFLDPNAAGKSKTVKMEGGRVVFGVEEADCNNPPINRSVIEAGLHSWSSVNVCPVLKMSTESHRRSMNVC